MSKIRLAHIVPISLLDCVPVNQRTHLVLSELVLSSRNYREFYNYRAQCGDYLILDNPVHEDRPVSIDSWLLAVETIKPDIAVIPDVIDSGRETIDNATEATARFKLLGLSNTGLMAVPHGTTQEAWLYCARALATLDIRWLGLSLERRLNDDGLAVIRRRERIQLLNDNSEFDGLNLHLLGLSETAVELSGDPIWKRAVSVDTSKFVVWCMAGQFLRPPVPITESYPGRYGFGGSFGYFFTNPDEMSVSRRKLRNNLKRWCTYAEREEN